MNWSRQIHIKSPAELQIMREAGRINATVLATSKELLQPGVSTADLNAAAEEVLRKHGCVSPFKGYGHPPFPASITVSINQELVHGIPSKKRKLKEGDIVSIDCGTVLKDLWPIQRSPPGSGKSPRKRRNFWRSRKERCMQASKRCVLGNRTGDISAAIQNYVESHGYHVTREYTGHGVGRQMHEGPQVPNYGKPGTGMPLKAGMTIALEPMVLVGTAETRVLPDQWTVVSADGSLTAHFEHSVAVTEGEPLILTVP